MEYLANWLTVGFSLACVGVGTGIVAVGVMVYRDWEHNLALLPIED